jgi:hypothetical protein
MSFGDAYQENAAWKLFRQMSSTPDGRQLEIADVIAGDGAVSMQENLVTQKEPVVEKNRVVLNGEKGRVVITVSGQDGSIDVIKEVFRNHHGEDEAVWLLRFSVAVEKGTGICVMQCRYEAK